MGFTSAYLVVLAASRLRMASLQTRRIESLAADAPPERALKHPVNISAVQRLLMERLTRDLAVLRSARSNLERAAFTSLVAIDVECCRQSAVPRELIDAALTNADR